MYCTGDCPRLATTPHDSDLCAGLVRGQVGEAARQRKGTPRQSQDESTCVNNARVVEQTETSALPTRARHYFDSGSDGGASFAA